MKTIQGRSRGAALRRNAASRRAVVRIQELEKNGLNVNLVSHIDVEVVEMDSFKWRFTGIYGELKADEKEKT